MSDRLTAIEQFRRRLKGVHRVHWSASDVHLIAKRFGLVERDILSAVPALPIRFIPRAIGNAGTEMDFTATISAAGVDHMGDTIAVSGWKLDAFRNNPVVFFNHLSGELPVARSPSIWIAGNKLKASIKLAPAAANPVAEQVRQLIHGRFLCAVSVGFIPTKWEFAKDSSRPYGIDFLQQTLLEFSIVGVPANGEAMIDAVAVPIGSGKSSQREATLRRERELAALKRMREAGR
jgi:HK97 family phage prohead protease